jgi:hypothetical protein
MVFDSNPGPPATLLPRRVDHGGSYRVVLAGPMTSVQQDKIRKLHHARGGVVKELLRFYKAYNRLYADVAMDGELIDRVDDDTTLCDRIFGEVEDPQVGAAVDAEQDSVTSSSDAVPMRDGDEYHVIERRVLLAEEYVVTNTSCIQRC